MRYICGVYNKHIRVFNEDTGKMEYILKENVNTDCRTIDGVFVVDGELDFRVSDKHNIFVLKLQMSNMDKLRRPKSFSYDEIDCILHPSGIFEMANSFVILKTQLTEEEIIRYSSNKYDKVKDEIYSLFNIIDYEEDNNEIC